MEELLDGDGCVIGAHPSPSKRTLDGTALGFFSILDGRFQPMALSPVPPLRPFRRPLSQKTGPAIRSFHLLVTAAAGWAAALRIPNLSTSLALMHTPSLFYRIRLMRVEPI